MAVRPRRRQQVPCLLPPSDQFSGIHIPGFRTLISRSDKGQSGLLHLPFRRGRGLLEHRPCLISLKVVLQDTRGGMFDVIRPNRLRMSLTKQANAFSEIGTAITDNVSWDPCLGNRLFQLFVDHRAGLVKMCYFGQYRSLPVLFRSWNKTERGFVLRGIPVRKNRPFHRLLALYWGLRTLSPA